MAEKHRTKGGYPPDALRMVRAGLLHVAVKLGDHLDDLAVVGGAAPSLLVDQSTATTPHVGTTDLDLALALGILKAERYRDLAGRLRDAGFAPLERDGKVIRQTWVILGKVGRITIDFMIPPSPNGDRARLLQDLASDFAAVKTRGLALVFDDQRQVELDGVTIDGDRATRRIAVAGPAAMVVLKAFAFENRGAEKDAYDLYYLVKELGVDEVAVSVARHRAKADVAAALAILERDFTDDAGVGPGAVARFLGEGDELRADVVGLVSAVLRRVSAATR